MIFALTGTLSAGKSVLAEFLREECGFTVINLVEEFAKRHCPDADQLVTLKHFFSGK
jgi:dephospho-CoA kinase